MTADGVALHSFAWSLKATDPAGKPFELSSRTTDVLRRQSDGTWLLAIDNPWSTAIFGR